MARNTRQTQNTSTPPVQAGRFFTMVNMNQGTANNAASRETITDLVVPSSDPTTSNSSQFLPGNAGSAYATGMIASHLYSEERSNYGWAAIPPLQNDAIINQAAFLQSLGSVVMSFNLSQNQEAIRRATQQVTDNGPETANLEPETLSREVENAICESIVKTRNQGEFVSAIQTIYQETYASTVVLGGVYEDIQNLSAIMGLGEDPANAMLDFSALANATEPLVNTTAGVPNTPVVDPIGAAQLVGRIITPPSILGTPTTAPTFVLYEEQSSELSNAVLVNNLVLPQISVSAGMLANQAAQARRPGGL